MNKIVYVTKPPFLDFDLPIIKRLNLELDLTVLIMVAPHSKSATIFDLSNINLKQGFIGISQIKEHLPIYYENFLNFNKTYLYNTNTSSIRSFSNILGQLKLYKFIKKSKFKTIYTNGHLGLSFLLPLFDKSLTFYLNIHDPFPHSGEINKLDEWSKKVNIKKSSKFILFNNSQKEEFITHFNLKKNQVITTNIGLYESYDFLKKNNKTQFYTNYSKPTLFFFGRIIPYKGIEYLIQAVNELNQEGLYINTVIAGAGKPYFDTSIINNSHTTFINKYLTQFELSDLLQSTDVVVCPYADATQSGVIVTAYTFGKPIIATDTGGLSEMLIDQNMMFLAKPKSVSSLKHKIKLWHENYNNNFDTEISKTYRFGNKSWDYTVAKILNHLQS